MATNFLIKINANGVEVTGESQDSKYSGWIEVLAYEWGGSRLEASGSGVRLSGKVNMSSFVFRKRADRASPLLFKALTNNENVKAEMVLRKAGGEMEDYMHIELNDAVVTKFTQGNLAYGGESPEEEVHISYQSIKMIYDVQDQRSGITRGGIEHEHVIMGAY
ncbi:MAG: type VI secretion system tube protein Hcp [Bryobacterales bacterium]|nr:type VI secretion system tube protein Hcp [Bryobacterales bacterium]